MQSTTSLSNIQMTVRLLLSLFVLVVKCQEAIVDEADIQIYQLRFQGPTQLGLQLLFQLLILPPSQPLKILSKFWECSLFSKHALVLSSFYANAMASLPTHAPVLLNLFVHILVIYKGPAQTPPLP